MGSALVSLLRLASLGVGLAAGLAFAERNFGFSSDTRFWIGGLMLSFGSLLMSGDSGRFLYERALFWGISDADVAEYVQTKRANLAASVRLMVLGAVIVGSEFVI